MSPAAVLSILVRAQGAKVAATQLNGVDAAARKAGASADQMSKRSGAGFKEVAKQSKYVALGVAGIAGAAVKAAADFQTSMNTLQAVSNATGRQMSALRKEAIKLGADVHLPATSAKDAAEAMTEMVKAGVSVKDTMAGARSVLVLSAAAGVDNARAAEIASNALNAFRLRGKDTKIVVDQLANTANSSSVEINDVADSFKMAAAVFNAFQTPTLGAKRAMTELNVAIGLLGNAGIKGSDAGTSLKQALLQLTGPSMKSKDAMKALYIAAKDAGANEKLLAGITREGAKARGDALKSLIAHNKALGGSADIAYDAAGRMRSLHDIVALVTKGTKDMTAEERNSYLTQIFGADAVRSITILMQAQNGQWGKMEKAVGRAGAAQQVANAKMKGLNGAMEAFKSTIETLAITFGTTLLPPLTSAFRALASLGPTLQQNKTLIMIVVGALGALAAGTWAVNLAMAANPFVAAGVALGVLAVALVKAYQSSATFRAVVQTAFGAVAAAAGVVKTAMLAAVQWVTDATHTVIGEVRQWDTLWSVIKRVFGLITGGARLLFDSLKLIFHAGLLALAPIVVTAWTGIKDIFSGAWTAIKGIVSGGFTVLRGIVKIIGGLFKGDFHQVWEGVKGIFRGQLQAVKGILQGAWQILKAPVDAIGAGLHDAFAHSWDRIKGVFRDGANAVIDYLNQLIKAINLIPGVPDIGLIGRIGGGGGGPARPKQQNLGQTGHLARGGAFGRTGGVVNNPMVFMGEQAPQHPEYVIPTNPAYRKRAHGLLAQAAGAIGLADGGIFSQRQIAALWTREGGNPAKAADMSWVAMAESHGDAGINYGGGHLSPLGQAGKLAAGLYQILGLPFPGDVYDAAVNTRMAIVKSNNGTNLHPWDASRSVWGPHIGQGIGGGGILGAIGHAIGGAVSSIGDLIGKLPHPHGLGIFQGLGSYVLDRVTGFVKNTVASIIPGGGGAGSTTGLVPQVQRALAWARSHGWTGSVISGFRSRAKQQYLWDHAAQLGLVRGKTVAAPGTSSHERGQAVDVSDVPGFMRAMAMAPPNARLIHLAGDYPHFSVTGHALGTSGAQRGLAWVGERGPELVNFAGGEQVFSNAESMRMAGRMSMLMGYAKGTFGGTAKHPTYNGFDIAFLLKTLGLPVGTPTQNKVRLLSYLKHGGPGMAGPMKGVLNTGSPVSVSADSGEDPNQPLIDSNNALADAEKALADALAGVKASIDAQTAFATSVANTSNYQLTKTLADVISGHIVGYGVTGRAFTPGSGNELRY